MAKKTEVKTGENKTNGTDEVQEGEVVKQSLREKLEDITSSIKEQSEKNATKKDVWKGVLVTVLSIAASVAFGV